MNISKISEISKFDRPREKLQAKGPAALSDFELLKALIGSGNAQSDVAMIAKRVITIVTLTASLVHTREVFAYRPYNCH